jgi:tetratricopeptide (TPR) repeat protein
LPPRIGRYVVLRELGRGGMGVVYAAYDEELDRRIALKVLHASRAADADARARILRESRALARLSHPNVVHVYEVGDFEGSVYLAMEHVHGVTLRQWLKEPRPWRASLAMLIETGRGLSAAHHASLVHRDFKPANVLVGDDGRPRVLDFGLARASDGEATEDEPVAASVAPALALVDPLASHLTVANTLLGTPAYMAPEQWLSLPAGPAADQYAFAVTVYETLYGRRPYEGTGPDDDLRGRVLAGQVPPPPRGTPVPARLFHVLRRALAVSAGERWPTMDELLVALERDPSRALWFGLGGAIAGLALLAGGYGLAARDGAAAPACRDVGAEIDAVWREERRAEITGAFLSTGKDHAAATFDRLEPLLDGYARAWSGARVDACLAHQRGEHDARVFGLQLACLGRRKAAFDTLLTVLGGADQGVLDRSIQAAEDLPAIAACEDVAALTAAVPPPDDRAIAEEVARLRDELELAHIDQQMHRYDAGMAISARVLARAAQLGYLPLEAEALYLHGRLLRHASRFDEAIEFLTRAVWRADRVRDDRTLAKAMSLLVDALSEGKAAYPEALRWQPHADTVIGRLGPGSREEAMLVSSFSSVLSSLNRGAEAMALARRAVAIAEAAYGPDDYRVAQFLDTLARSHFQLGEFPQAAALVEREVAIQERHLGPGHPELAEALGNLGAVHATAGDLARALPFFKRALALNQAVVGLDHPNLETDYLNLGELLGELGEYAAAREHLERSLALAERTHGASHPRVGVVLRVLGGVLDGLGERATARAGLERAVAIFREIAPQNTLLTAGALSDLGWLESRLGDTRSAILHLEEALALRTADPGGNEPALTPTIQFRLASLLRAGNAKDRARADALAEEALAALVVLDPGRHREAIAMLERWRDERGSPGARRGRR